MPKKLMPTIADLLNEPEKNLKDKSSGLVKTFGQGSLTSLIIFVIMWCLTMDISFNEALKMIISGSLALIGLSFFALGKYFLSRLHKTDSFLVIIAEKHKIAQESSAYWESKFRLLNEENRQLKEDIAILAMEVNRIVVELTAERQKDFTEEEILVKVNEAITSAQ